MIKLRGDRDGFAGRYEHKETGYTWTVSKFYFGRGLGAGWKVAGPFFDDSRVLDWSSARKVVSNWRNEGVEKVA